MINCIYLMMSYLEHIKGEHVKIEDIKIKMRVSQCAKKAVN